MTQEKLKEALKVSISMLTEIMELEEVLKEIGLTSEEYYELHDVVF